MNLQEKLQRTGFDAVWLVPSTTIAYWDKDKPGSLMHYQGDLPPRRCNLFTEEMLGCLGTSEEE